MRNITAPSSRRVGWRHGGRPVAEGWRPDRTLEAEAVHFHHPAPRRRPFKASACVDEAAFLQNAAGGRILNAGVRQNFHGAGQLKARIDDRSRRFAGVALAPNFRRQGIAKRQSPLRPALDADHAEWIAFTPIGGDGEDEVLARRIGLAHHEDEALGFAGGVRMRDARGILRDLPLRRIALDRGSVGNARPAQPEPPRLQAKDVVAGDIGKHCRSSPSRRPFRPTMTKGRRLPPVSKVFYGPSGLSKERFLLLLRLGLAAKTVRGALAPARGLFGAPLIPPLASPSRLRNSGHWPWW